MRDDPVFICGYCGTGFPRWPGDFHQHPRWWTSDAESGGPCGGPVIKASRAMQIRTFERMEREDDENRAARASPPSAPEKGL